MVIPVNVYVPIFTPILKLARYGKKLNEYFLDDFTVPKVPFTPSKLFMPNKNNGLVPSFLLTCNSPLLIRNPNNLSLKTNSSGPSIQTVYG